MTSPPSFRLRRGRVALGGGGREIPPVQYRWTFRLVYGGVGETGLGSEVLSILRRTTTDLATDCVSPVGRLPTYLRANAPRLATGVLPYRSGLGVSTLHWNKPFPRNVYTDLLPTILL